MNKYRKTLAALVLSLISTCASALEIQKAVTVTQIIPIAAIRPAAAGSQNFVAVNINPVDWGTPNCRGDSVFIAESDRHLISILLSGIAMGKSLSFSIDDTLAPVYGTYCQLIYITVNL